MDLMVSLRIFSNLILWFEIEDLQVFSINNLKQMLPLCFQVLNVMRQKLDLIFELLKSLVCWILWGFFLELFDLLGHFLVSLFLDLYHISIDATALVLELNLFDFLFVMLCLCILLPGLLFLFINLLFELPHSIFILKNHFLIWCWLLWF